MQIDEFSPSEKLAHRFFANLLPEASARLHIVRDMKLADSDFELLNHLGGECAGALTILPIESKPNNKLDYKKLCGTDLTKLLEQKGAVYNLSLGNELSRFSLAGAQDKCPIYFDGIDYFQPQDASPSTHILKFELADYRHVPVYEYFMAQLASTINLPVVECQLENVEGSYYLLIKRYDRISDDHSNIYRLHQEDFCQALGVGYESKYQQDGGPSFYDCYNLIQRVSAKPIEDAENLLKWQMFNFLAGNSDGHAKNLALIYNKNQEVRLAPFYDMVCTRAIERIDTKLAMAIGEQFKPHYVMAMHWKQLAESCMIQASYLLELLAHTAESLMSNVIEQRAKFEEFFCVYPALQRIENVIRKQCKKTLKDLT